MAFTFFPSPFPFPSLSFLPLIVNNTYLYSVKPPDQSSSLPNALPTLALTSSTYSPTLSGVGLTPAARLKDLVTECKLLPASEPKLFPDSTTSETIEDAPDDIDEAMEEAEERTSEAVAVGSRPRRDSTDEERVEMTDPAGEATEDTLA